jgi:predicted methyltransferase
MIPPLVLSHFQTKRLLEHYQAGGGHIRVSPDLGLNLVEVTLELGGAVFPGGEMLSWESIEEINASENNCYIIQEGEPQKILTFSEFTNLAYSLMPTQGAPTMLVSGIPMHRIKGTDPHDDTLEKIKAIKPVTGQVLDTATGLGYTAIEASKTAQHVTTMELAPEALEIARHNPWSYDLFNNPRITSLIGDSYDLVKEFEAERFSRIIHDPPTFRFAEHLYSGAFYAELHRVLRTGGRLFHYIGDPKSKTGRITTRGVTRRLGEAGFTKVTRWPRAFGVVAFKRG